MSSVTLFSYIIFFYFSLVAARTLPSMDSGAQLFKHKDFAGPETIYNLGSSAACRNFNGMENDSYSSVDPRGSCIVLCEDAHCRGQCIEIVQQVSDLAVFGFSDKASSIKGCRGNTSR